jgi:meso-butanediol dehydrogenase / (S,S)-butanediol dehydrogenase / diacetyl reductase
VGALDGKTAIVTGAGQGVGRGIALALAGHGANLCLAGRTGSKLVAVAAEVEQRGGKATTVVCDVKRPDDIDRCVGATLRAWGGIDILVNNAQETPMGAIVDVTDDDLQAGWESGPLATFRFMRRCHPHLRDGGVVVNLGSSASVNPNPVGRGVYGALKASTQTLSRAAAVEWGSDGIRVIAILPAATSPAAEAFARDNPEEVARSMAGIPIGRLGDPESEIGAVVAFLCGPDARYLTGVTLPIDGGQAFLR